MSKDYARAQNMCLILNYDKSEDIRCKTSRIRIRRIYSVYSSEAIYIFVKF